MADSGLLFVLQKGGRADAGTVTDSVSGGLNQNDKLSLCGKCRNDRDVGPFDTLQRHACSTSLF